MTIIKQKDDQTNPKLYISPCGRVIKQNFQVPRNKNFNSIFRSEDSKFSRSKRTSKHLCQLCTQCCLLPSDCSPKKVVVTSIHWNSFLLIWANSYYSIPKPVFFGYFGEASPTQKKPFGGDQPAENGRWNLPRVDGSEGLQTKFRGLV